jgi:RNA polymerase sigma-70 factor (ECF subfamily)
MNQSVYESELATLADALERLAAARDNQAWSYVIHHAGADIERVAARVAGESDLATDAVQETLLQIRDYAGSFRRGADEVDPDAAARRWIVRVAVNTTCKLIRTRVRLRARHRQAAEAAAMSTESPGDVVDRKERDEAVRAALVQLPQRQSEAIVLHHIEGLEFAQVASALGCPVGTAKTNVRRGLETLRQSLARTGMALSLTAVVGALNGLQAATITTGAAGAAGLVSAQGKASAFVLVKTAGGIVMATKIAAISVAVVAAVITPFALTQEQENMVDKAPPIEIIQAEAQPAENPADIQAIAANEAGARASLKSGILPAAVQFQAGGYLDRDRDGIGEYGFLNELSGKNALTSQLNNFSLIGKELGSGIVNSYQFAIFLPDGKGGAQSEPGNFSERRGDAPEAVQEQEHNWLAIAWPIDHTKGGNCYAMTQDGSLLEQPYDGKKPDWNDVVDRIGGAEKWPLFVETEETKWKGRLVPHLLAIEGGIMPIMLGRLAYQHESSGTWPNLQNSQLFPVGIGNGQISTKDVEPGWLFFYYCRPSEHPSPRQPLLIENPKCNPDGGCHVGFIDIDSKRQMPSEAIDMKVLDKELKKMYPSFVAYANAPQASRLWQTAIRLADSPKAHDQGLTLDDWAEVSDILDAIAKPVEQWPAQ